MKKYIGVISFIILSSMLHAQYFTQQAKLVGTGVTPTAQQGASVAISGDGSTAIIGGPRDDGRGAVYIFVKSGGQWVQQGSKLFMAGDFTEQGSKVDISYDGNTAAAGCRKGVGVFIRNGGIWTQQGTVLSGTGGIGNSDYVYSAAVSADGNTIIIGNQSDNNNIGAAWIFTRDNNGVWTQQGDKLVGTGYSGQSYQGRNVAISDDGNTAAVGAEFDNNRSGAVWIYIRDNNGVWTQQGQKLTGPAGYTYGDHGRSIALSADGNTLIMGTYTSNTGSATIYVRSSGIWQIQSTVTPTGGAGTYNAFGSAVSLSSDGNTAVIGANGDDSYKGAFWIFVRSGNTWTQQGGKLTGSGGIGQASQGAAAGISSDGNTVIVGGYGDNRSIGAFWIFDRSGTVWNQNGGKLTAADAAGAAYQGGALSISGDGNTIISGGQSDNASIGAAWVFKRNGNSWSQQGEKFTGSGAEGWGSYFGNSASLSADGNKAIIGASNDNNGIGAVWFFSRDNNGIWTQQGTKMVGTNAVGNASQGINVAMSADGSTAIEAGLFDNSLTGAAWVYKNNGGNWIQQGTKLTGQGTAAYTYQGNVAISGDGNTAVLGGTNDDNGKGAVWVFVRNGEVWSQQGPKLVGQGGVGRFNMGNVAISADGNTLIAGGYEDDGSKGAAWIFVRNSGVWSQQGDKLVGTGAVGNSRQGYSVAISADGNVAVIGGLEDNQYKGAVWVFVRQNGVWTQLGSKITATGVGPFLFLGQRVAVSSDGNTIAASGSGDSYGAGAVWVFKAQTYTITASAGANGVITPSGESPVMAGTSKTYTIQPDAGYAVQDVLVDGVSAGAVTTYTFSNVSAAHTISATFTETVDNSITVPVVVYPANGIMVYTNSPVAVWYTLKWVPALKYRVQVASDAAFTSVIFDQTNISAQYTFLSGLSSGTQYYARVRGVTSSGSKGAWSQAAVFSTVTAPGQIPLVPKLVYPAGGALVYTDRPVAAWYIPSYGPGLKYNLQLSTTEDFSNIIVNAVNITNISYNLSGLTADGVYYLRVRSYTPQGLYSDFSPVETFRVSSLFGTQALTPNIIYPAGGASVYSTTAVITWIIPGYSPSETFNLQVSARPDFQTFVLNQENITGLSHTLTGLAYGTTYYARIRGRVGTGAYSLFSAIVPFTVITADWLVSPIAGSPVEEVELTSPGAVLSWYTPSSAGQQEVRYDLQISNDAGFTRPQTVNAITGQSYNLTGLKSDSKYYWRVRSRTENGKISAYSNEGIFVTGKVTTHVDKHDGEVKDYTLKQNYPNPFNPVTTIEFTVKNNGWARLEVIDILGKVIKTLVNEDLQAGTYTVTMNGQGMSSGIYFYKLTTPDRQIINKMILSK